jgi:hypothetical protein
MRKLREVRMGNSMIRIVTLATCSIALIAAFSFTPAAAAGGGGGGGGPESDMDQGRGYSQPSSYPNAYPNTYPRRSGTKAIHVPKVKKANKQSSIEDPAFREGYRAAYATIYDRNDYAAAIEQL